MEEKNHKFCFNCGAQIDIRSKICPKCGLEQSASPQKVSNWWYLCSIFLGIVGGIIAWAVNKEINPKKARRLLIVGIIVPIILTILYFILVYALINISLGGARTAAKDARIRSAITQARTQTELIWADTQSYATLCSSSGRELNGTNLRHGLQLDALNNDIKEQQGGVLVMNCFADTNRYCINAKLVTNNNYFCVDSAGRAIKNTQPFVCSQSSISCQ